MDPTPAPPGLALAQQVCGMNCHALEESNSASSSTSSSTTSYVRFEPLLIQSVPTRLGAQDRFDYRRINPAKTLVGTLLMTDISSSQQKEDFHRIVLEACRGSLQEGRCSEGRRQRNGQTCD